MYLHAGGFTTGDKADDTAMLQWLCSKGYVAATATVTETVFAINGLGRYFVSTIAANDINGTVAVAAFSGVCTLTGALLADVVAAWLDPRIRLS